MGDEFSSFVAPTDIGRTDGLIIHLEDDLSDELITGANISTVRRKSFDDADYVFSLTGKSVFLPPIDVGRTDYVLFSDELDEPLVEENRHSPTRRKSFDDKNYVFSKTSKSVFLPPIDIGRTDWIADFDSAFYELPANGNVEQNNQIVSQSRQRRRSTIQPSRKDNIFVRFSETDSEPVNNLYNQTETTPFLGLNQTPLNGIGPSTQPSENISSEVSNPILTSELKRINESILNQETSNPVKIPEVISAPNILTPSDTDNLQLETLNPVESSVPDLINFGSNKKTKSLDVELPPTTNLGITGVESDQAEVVQGEEVDKDQLEKVKAQFNDATKTLDFPPLDGTQEDVINIPVIESSKDIVAKGIDNLNEEIPKNISIVSEIPADNNSNPEIIESIEEKNNQFENFLKPVEFTPEHSPRPIAQSSPGKDFSQSNKNKIAVLSNEEEFQNMDRDLDNPIVTSVRKKPTHSNTPPRIADTTPIVIEQSQKAVIATPSAPQLEETTPWEVTSSGEAVITTQLEAKDAAIPTAVTQNNVEKESVPYTADVKELKDDESTQFVDDVPVDITNLPAKSEEMDTATEPIPVEQSKSIQQNVEVEEVKGVPKSASMNAVSDEELELYTKVQSISDEDGLQTLPTITSPREGNTMLFSKSLVDVKKPDYDTNQAYGPFDYHPPSTAPASTTRPSAQPFMSNASVRSEDSSDSFISRDVTNKSHVQPTITSKSYHSGATTRNPPARYNKAAVEQIANSLKLKGPSIHSLTGSVNSINLSPFSGMTASASNQNFQQTPSTQDRENQEISSQYGLGGGNNLFIPLPYQHSIRVNTNNNSQPNNSYNDDDAGSVKTFATLSTLASVDYGTPSPNEPSNRLDSMDNALFSSVVLNQKNGRMSPMQQNETYPPPSTSKYTSNSSAERRNVSRPWGNGTRNNQYMF